MRALILPFPTILVIDMPKILRFVHALQAYHPFVFSGKVEVDDQVIRFRIEKGLISMVAAGV